MLEENKKPSYFRENGEIETYGDRYFCTPNGKVFSLNYNHTKTVKEITGYIDKEGYCRLCIRNDENIKRCGVGRARLIASTFISIPDELKQYPLSKLEVNHINEFDKSNDSVDNLEWVLDKSNVSYGTRNQRAIKTRETKDPNYIERNKKLLDSKIKTGYVKPIILTKDGVDYYYKSYCEAARAIGTTPISVSEVCRGVRGKRTIKGYTCRYA